MYLSRSVNESSQTLKIFEAVEETKIIIIKINTKTGLTTSDAEFTVRGVSTDSARTKINNNIKVPATPPAPPARSFSRKVVNES